MGRPDRFPVASFIIHLSACFILICGRMGAPPCGDSFGNREVAVVLTRSWTRLVPIGLGRPGSGVPLPEAVAPDFSASRVAGSNLLGGFR